MNLSRWLHARYVARRGHEPLVMGMVVDGKQLAAPAGTNPACPLLRGQPCTKCDRFPEGYGAEPLRTAPPGWWPTAD